MSTKHTGGTWSVSRKGGAVVSTDAIPGLPDYRTGHADADYYGGYLIAESIWSPADARVVAASPDLLASLCNMVGLAEEAIEIRANSSVEEDHEMLPVYQQQLAEARAAIAKATGEQS